jgi:TetR/AcrR family transcriptional repressor of multidrug resistance operon
MLRKDKLLTCARMIVQSDIPDKRKAILKSTLELIKDNGFHGTPISLIAKNADVASGTIYHYFPSKDAIIMALYSQIKDEMVAAMFIDANTKKSYKQQFFDGWISLCKYFINNPSSLIFIEQFNSSPFAKIVAAKDSRVSVSKFNEFFQLGMDKGYVKKMEYLLIASAVFGCITATAKYHLAGRYGFKDADLCKVATILWDGIKIQ